MLPDARTMQCALICRSMPSVDMFKVMTAPSGVPTSHARAVLAASSLAVVAQRGTGRMGHLVRPWQDSNLHGAGAHTGGRPGSHAREACMMPLHYVHWNL